MITNDRDKKITVDHETGIQLTRTHERPPEQILFFKLVDGNNDFFFSAERQLENINEKQLNITYKNFRYGNGLNVINKIDFEKYKIQIDKLIRVFGYYYGPPDSSDYNTGIKKLNVIIDHSADIENFAKSSGGGDD